MSELSRVYNLLVNSAPVSNLVGDRIYIGVAPAETQSPYIVLTHVYSYDTYGLPTERVLMREMFQVAVIQEDTYSVELAKQVLDAVDDTLRGVHEDANGAFAIWRVGYVEHIVTDDGLPYAHVIADYMMHYRR